MIVAASRDSGVNRVALGSAALSGVGAGDIFEGSDERASRGRGLRLVEDCSDDAGVGLAAGLR